MNDQCSSNPVIRLRKTLGLTQPRFAALIGVTPITVSRWQSGTKTSAGSEVILVLLGSVLDIHSGSTVLTALRPVRGDPLSIVRVLAWLERRDAGTQHLPTVAAPPIPPGSSPLSESWPRRIKALREQLGLTQESLATNLGITAKAISGWAKEGRAPSDFGELALKLVSSALKVHSPATVLRELKEAGGDRLALVRKLTWLEQHPSVPLTIPDGAPPSLRRP